MLSNSRQIRRHNKMCAEEAVSRGKVIFEGRCAKHGKTTRVIRISPPYDPWSECQACARERSADYHAAITADPEDLARKRLNSKLKLEAMKKGLNKVDLVCKRHGKVPHYINNRGSIHCCPCELERQRIRYHRKKHEQSANN